jgi:CHAT domain-containing protein/tetratricopeptide (TPR) repeat protein
MLQEEKRQATIEALERLIDADDIDDMRVVLEQERELLLSDEADTLLAPFIEQLARSEDRDEKQRSAFFQAMRIMLHQARETGIATAYESFVAAVETQILSVNDALERLIRARTWARVQVVLEQDQELLLTRVAESLLAERLHDAKQRTDEHKEQRIRHLQTVRRLLRLSREKGTAEAIRAMAIRSNNAMADETKVLIELLDIWVRTPTIRKKRRFLEEHLALLVPASEDLLKEGIEIKEYDSKLQRIWRGHLSILRLARESGGSVEAVRHAYVDLAGGFTLDLPPWLEAVEQQLETLEKGGTQTAEQRAELLQAALADAQNEPDLAPPILAELWLKLGDALGSYPQTSQTRAEAVKTYHAALHIYNRDSYPQQYARMYLRLGNLYARSSVGERSANLEQAIACYKRARATVRRALVPALWASIQMDLGNSYLDMVDGDQRTHREQAIGYAIGHFDKALSVYTREAYPQDWARIQNKLGNAYRNRSAGDRQTNQERALACHQEALSVYTREAFPVEWARTQINLGVIFYERLSGERSLNVEHALLAYENALSVFTREAFPAQWAALQRDLSDLFRRRMIGTRRENIEQAIASGRGALEYYQRDTFPLDRAATLLNLGAALIERSHGDVHQNIQQAIICFQEAQTLLDADTQPLLWAMLQMNMGIAYVLLGSLVPDRRETYELALQAAQRALGFFNEETTALQWATCHIALSAAYCFRISGQKNRDLQKAIEHGLLALRIVTSEQQPFEWATVHANLGEAYRQAALYADLRALYGGRAQMQELALEHVELACRVFTREGYPLEYAKARRCLGMLYTDRIMGQQSENLERARQCLSEVLDICQRETFPFDWAIAQILLGNIFLSTQVNRQEAIEAAIACYQRSLEICTPEQHPVQWATNQANLCAAYLSRTDGEQHLNIEQALKHGEAALKVYTREADPPQWADLQKNLGLLYGNRIEGEARVNNTWAIAHCLEALTVYTREEYPWKWASIQFVLSSLYSARVEGQERDNLHRSLRHGQAALEVYTEEDASRARDWALLQVAMAEAYHKLANSATDGNLSQAWQHYNAALRVFTREASPLAWAMIHMDIGKLFIKAADYERAEENRAAAASCFSNALEVYTRQTAPSLWANLQISLAANCCDPLSGEEYRPEGLKQAFTYLQEAGTVFTASTFPAEYRQLQQMLLLYEVQRKNWQGVVQAARNTSLVEKTLLLQSTGVAGSDVLLKTNVGSAPFGAYALLRQNLPIEAVLMLEQGRTRWLASALTRRESYATRIQDPQRRERYTSALKELQYAQNALAHMTTWNPGEYTDNQDFLARTNACAEAQQAFNTVVDEIRAAGDPQDFLDDTVSMEMIQEAAATGGPGHALVYLAALPNVGGFALAMLSPDVESQDQTQLKQGLPRLLALDLPEFTYDLVFDLINREVGGIPGGLAHAQDIDLQRMRSYLRNYTGDETWRDIAQEAEAAVQKYGSGATLMAALLAFTQHADLAPFIDKPYHTLSEEELAIIQFHWVKHFLKLEIEYCQEKLAAPLFTPLVTWLQTLGIGSLTLIPCGYLIDLPLTTLFVDRKKTLGDILPTSIAPSARALLTGKGSRRLRSGVYALGDPRKNLPWGEAEAQRVAKVARLAGLPSRMVVQEKLSREVLRRALREAEVIDLACHGRVYSDHFLQSYVQLAGEDFTLADMLSQQEEARGLRLMILSACQTAIPDVRGAVDEVRSLAAAMLQAGVRAVMATLWPVDDQATYLLVWRFAQEWFPHMSDEPPARALARAQHWLRAATNRELARFVAAHHSPLTEEDNLPAADTQFSLSPAMAFTASRGYRYDLAEARSLIWHEAARHDPDATPYADPIYWAGLQIIGW